MVNIYNLFFAGKNKLTEKTFTNNSPSFTLAVFQIQIFSSTKAFLPSQIPVSIFALGYNWLNSVALYNY